MENDLISQINSITSFETMSNELLMVLFEYYDFYSLFSSFHSLNSRLDRIIYGCQVHINLDQVKPIDFVDFLSHIFPQINVNNIVSLPAINPHQIVILASDKCLIYLKDLRSLSLQNSRTAIVHEMMSRLERVVLGPFDGDYVHNDSLFKHFVDSNRYIYLRTYKDKVSRIKRIESFLSVEHVSLSEKVHSTDFFHFLNQCPDLKTLTIRTDFSDDYYQSGYTLPTLLYDTIIHLNLFITGHYNEKILIYLFQSLPRIRRLNLSCFTRRCPHLVDPSFWERSLSTYLIGLQRLSLTSYADIDISLLDPYWNYLLNEEEVCHQIEESTYWSSHGWKPIFSIKQSRTNNNYYGIKFVYNEH